MIKKGIPFLLIFGLAILFSSCKKDSTTEPTPELGANATGTFTASINGLNWQSTKVWAYKQEVYTRFSGIQAISNSASPYSSIRIYIDLQYVPGYMTYDIGVNSEQHSTFNAHAHMDCVLKSNGATKTYTAHYMAKDNLSSMNLTSYSSSFIEGTFAFRSINTDGIPDTVDVVNGTFRLNY